MLRRASAAAAGLGAVTAWQWHSWRIHMEDAAVEKHLPPSEGSPDAAQHTRVVRLPRLLSREEIESVHALHERLRPDLGTAGRTVGNQSAAYRQGKWETSYLSTDGVFAREMPELRARLLEAVRSVDEQHWRMMRRATEAVAPRCVEYHVVEAGGSLPFIHHHDGGSLITIDVMLSQPDEFQGGEFQTLEADGTMASYDFEQGDALVFVSHKPHCVQPVLAGRRSVLVMEVWEGLERTCAHRCELHWASCGHSARTSFWRRALSDLASDL
ncbi:hypothetical protein AB1Y20_000187 [Prymnesium parvum]|uniref:Prolyl 4-hydroxylase alpha subunit domain-containing protein n=1 Tax=Prymnesium parvum TaxID=97485 RepID=A0AB34K7S2_PRYPA